MPTNDLKIVVSNIGVTPGFSSIYTPNSGPHTAFVQVGLNAGHRLSSFQYMDLVRARLKKDLPQVAAYFQTGGLVDAILNLGMPAPLDIQVAGNDMERTHQIAAEIARKAPALPDVSDVLVPQDIDYPALQLDIDRLRTSELGPERKRSRRQCHHRADFRPDDCAELLGGPEKRQRLFAHRAVSRRFREKFCRPVVHPCARRKFRAPNAARYVEHHHVTAPRRRRWIIINCAAKWMFMFRPPAKTSAKF